MNFERLAEVKIQSAMEAGQFDNLPGEGKPLPPLAMGNAFEYFGYQMMKRAGAVPQEILVKKALQQQLKKLRATTDPEKRKAEMAVFADLQMQMNIMLEERR